MAPRTPSHIATICYQRCSGRYRGRRLNSDNRRCLIGLFQSISSVERCITVISGPLAAYHPKFGCKGPSSAVSCTLDTKEVQNSFHMARCVNYCRVVVFCTHSNGSATVHKYSQWTRHNVVCWIRITAATTHLTTSLSVGTRTFRRVGRSDSSYGAQ